jgi:protein-S-isoprenylcysteine O-methyltransferase Ste14
VFSFVLACILLVITNVASLRLVQEAYKFAPASKVQPILQVPAQVVPILIYFLVFRRSASGAAVLLIPLGVALILTSGFLLARRQAELQAS